MIDVGCDDIWLFRGHAGVPLDVICSLYQRIFEAVDVGLHVQSVQ